MGLRSLVIDIDNDHNTHETAERVAKMYLQEVFKGRYHQQPKVASFPNVKQLDEIYTVGPPVYTSWRPVQRSPRCCGRSRYQSPNCAEDRENDQQLPPAVLPIPQGECDLRCCHWQGMKLLVRAGG